MYHRYIYECRGVPDVGIPTPIAARGNASANDQKVAETQVGILQLGKDPKRIRFAKAQKGLCDGTPNRFIRASTGTRAVGIVCRRPIPDDTTGVSRLLRGGQRGESATAD